MAARGSPLCYTYTMGPKLSKEIKETKQQFFEQTLTLFNGALALIAALAWNEAVKALIDSYFPAGSGVYSKFMYAFIITLLVVIVSARLSKAAKKFNEQQSDVSTTQKN